MGAEAKRTGVTAQYDYYFEQLDSVVIPNIRRLLDSCRFRWHRDYLSAHRLAG